MGYQPAAYNIIKNENRWFYIVNIVTNKKHGPYCSLRQARRELKHLIRYQNIEVLIEQYNCKGERIV